MNAMQTGTVIDRPSKTSRASEGVAFAEPAPSPRWSHDPLEPDAVGDEPVLTTTRRMLRLAIAAADVGVRFARDGLDQDPAAWMVARRDLFDGRTAMDACQELTGFNRSIVLHGLGLGLDAAADAIDDLLADDDAVPAVDDDDVPAGSEGDAEPRLPRPRLLTCWVDRDEDATRLFAFCAVVTDRPRDLVERVIGRYGAQAAAQGRYAVGFDHSTPLATAMISDAMADTLALAASDPESPLAQGLDVVVEQRFVA